MRGGGSILLFSVSNLFACEHDCAIELKHVLEISDMFENLLDGLRRIKQEGGRHGIDHKEHCMIKGVTGMRAPERHKGAAGLRAPGN